MANYCKYCGKPLQEGARFCIGCGKPIDVSPTASNAAHKEQPSKTAIQAETNVKPINTVPNKGGFLNQLFYQLFDEIKDLLKHPKKLLPTIILSVVWMLFSILSTVGVNIPIFRFLYTLTYSNGGMFGGFFGAIGGIFGKAVFATVINTIVLSLFEKKNPFANAAKSLTGVFGKAAFSGLSAISPFLIGAGSGLVLYWFFNITSSPVNCSVAVVGAVGAFSAIGKKKGLLVSLIFSAAGKVSRGKLPSQVVVNRAITGFSAGFAIGLPLTFVRSGWLLFLIGAIILAAGIAFAIIGKNGIKKKAATAAMFILTSAMMISVLCTNVFAAELPEGSVDPVSDDDDSDIRPYRGRLTYTNGSENKYGQPFPDLMDFDDDGEITWFDLKIQKELSHDPDWLDRPTSKAEGVFLAILTGLLGAGGGLVGGIAGGLAGGLGSAAGEAVSGLANGLGSAAEEAVSGLADGISEAASENEKEDLGPYINRDADGDLIVKDPATGEESVYVANGDGSYTNPLTDVTYTESELKDSLESRAENADLIRQDNAVAKAAIDAHREDNQGKSWITKEAEAENAAQRAKEAAEADHNKYKKKLADNYGVYSGDDDLYAKIAEKKGKAEIEFYENTELESEYKNKQEYVETVEKVADTSMDVLADVTGRKDIKAAYTMAKNTVARTTEAYVNDKNIMIGMAQGAMEGTIGVIQDNVDGARNKLVANVVGETYKDAMDATINNKNMTEAVVGGIGKGLVNTGVDVGMDLVGDGVVSFMGDAAEDAIKNAVTKGAEVTKGSLVDGAKTLAGDLVKDGLEEAFEAPGDGSYTKPLTSATYTESELKDSLESRAENADLIRQDNAVAKEAAEVDQNKYKKKLADHYGVYSGDDDLYAKIAEEKGKAEIEFYENTELESEYKNKQEYVETVENVADTSMDVLADVTGRKDIKAAYTMTKNTVARTTEAYVNDKNVIVGMAQGATEGTIDVIMDNVDGAGNKLVANVVGETSKNVMNATINNENMTEAVVGGIGKGLVNTGVDVGMDLVGDGVVSFMGDAAEDAIKNAVTKGAEVTKGSLVNGAKTLAGDLVKDGLDEAFKAPDKE